MKTASTTNSPTVKITAGLVQGVMNGATAVFRGIPYAAPPVGELRWREPQPAPAWDGVRPAAAFGPACPQPITGIDADAGELGPQSEDCLTLNVWTPDISPASPLPVMVWIHGGALKIGAGSQLVYDGTALSERGAVVVTFNYRLGPLGFFAHPALEAADPGGPVNFGFLDQVAALTWVRDNIAAFGGDPGNVTIFGESAGGQSVLAHFASPLSQGLFQRGIVQSAYGIPSSTRSRALEAGVKLATGAGLNGADATPAELRGLPAATLGTLSVPGASLAPGFVIGDAALPEPILDAFEAGTEAAVPLIMGNNSDEASVAVAFGIDPATLLNNLVLAKVALEVLYPGIKDSAELGRLAIRDVIFTSFARRMTELHARRAPSWRYYFSYVPVNLRDSRPGVAHGDEIPFVMGTAELLPELKALWTDADRAMARRVGDTWFAFAQSGDPNAGGEPVWPQIEQRVDATLEFGETITVQKRFMQVRLDIFIGLLNLLGKLLDRE